MVRTPAGSPVSVFYFADVMPGAGAIRLAAAVVWRRAPDRAHGGARRWGRGPIAWMRRLRHHLWLRFGPLGIDVEWPGTRPDSGERRGVTSMHLSKDAEAGAYYDGRAVRVLGRVYKLPANGRSLVLLVDEGRRSAAGGKREAALRITTRTVPAPMAPLPTPPPEVSALDHGVPGIEGIDFRTELMVGGERPEWQTALRADPDVRAFMEADASA